MKNRIEIFQTKSGLTEIQVKITENSVWLSQKQMASLFEKDSDTIGIHIKNIFKEKELEENLTTEKNSVVQIEGKRNIKRIIKSYNLDVIISVGYRVNSIRGTQFRQWATQRLKDYLLEGMAINQKRLEEQNKKIQVLHDGIRIMSRAIEEKANDSDEFKWLQQYSLGLQLLDDYDHETLDQFGSSIQNANYPSQSDYVNIIQTLQKQTPSNLFGKQKDGGFESAIHQIQKGFDHFDLYPSIQEKAAMLLYLIVKNHSFVDGNKRIAAACFLLFLNKNQLLFRTDGQPIIENQALASITLFVATSQPNELQTVKKLVISILNRSLKN
jgi:prophage maintenance system killer protein